MVSVMTLFINTVFSRLTKVEIDARVINRHAAKSPGYRRIGGSSRSATDIYIYKRKVLH
jgi:hypothetical protein